VKLEVIMVTHKSSHRPVPVAKAPAAKAPAAKAPAAKASVAKASEDRDEDRDLGRVLAGLPVAVSETYADEHGVLMGLLGEAGANAVLDALHRAGFKVR
jgi:hypothetical protein